MPLFRNVASSIINFSIFLFYIKKDKRFKFPIFKKKTHENPKKTRVNPRPSSLRFNCPPIEIISGTGEAGRGDISM